MKIRFAVIAAVVLSLVSMNAGASTHPTYALGKAKTCHVNYMKKTETHVVKGKRVRYVACVYKAPVKAIAPNSPLVSVAVTPGFGHTLGTSPFNVASCYLSSYGQIACPVVGFDIQVSWNRQQPTGTEMLYVDSAIPPLCTLPVTSVCLVTDSSNPTTEVDGDIALEFPTPGTYKVSVVYSGNATYPSATSNIIVNASWPVQ